MYRPWAISTKKRHSHESGNLETSPVMHKFQPVELLLLYWEITACAVMTVVCFLLFTIKKLVLTKQRHSTKNRHSHESGNLATSPAMHKFRPIELLLLYSEIAASAVITVSCLIQ